MSKTVVTILKLLAALVICYAVVSIVGTAAQVAAAADRFYLGAGQPIFWAILALLTALAGAPLWLYFQLPKPKLPPADSAEPAYSEYLDWLRRSLARNQRLTGHPLQTTEDLEVALDVLGKEADRVVRETAASTFVSTAVMQNGRLDGLVMLVAQMRLVWKVASIYQLRPSPRQMLYLYGNVGASMLVSTNLEDVDFAELTAPIAYAVAPSLASAVPGLQGVGSLLVNSLANGAANAFLTLRVGMVAKAYASPLTLPTAKAVRKSASKAALALLGGIAKENGGRVASGIWSAMTGTAGAATRGALDGIRTASSKAAEAASNAGGNVVGTVKVATNQVTTASQFVARGAVDMGKSAGSVVAAAGSAMANNVQLAAMKVGSATVSASAKVSAVAVDATEQVRGAATDAVAGAAQTGKHIGQAVSSAASSTLAALGSGTTRARSDGAVQSQDPNTSGGSRA